MRFGVRKYNPVLRETLDGKLPGVLVFASITESPDNVAFIKENTRIFLL